MRAQINHARRQIAITTNVRQLKRLGYIQLGLGAFSRVLYHPDAPDVVIKIGTHRSRHKHFNHRDGFPVFAQRILNKEISSKFYPKIYHFEDFGTTFVAIMKRYYPIKDRARTAKTLSTTMVKLSGHPVLYRKPDLRRFGRALRPLTEPRFTNDIHSGNVMLDRSTNTPILTDPICIRSYE